MTTQPYRNNAYDAPARFATRRSAKSHQSHIFLQNLNQPPGLTEELNNGQGHYMTQTQERSYALNNSQMREVGQRGVHSLIDVLPIRDMGVDGVFAARPDRGTMYRLDWQLAPCVPIHPLSVMGYAQRAREGRPFDPQQRLLYIDTYDRQWYDDELGPDSQLVGEVNSGQP